MPAARSTESSDAERRRWPRAQADWPMRLALADGEHEARVRDVSRAGVSFFLDRPLPLMTRLRVDLELPVEGGKRFVTGEGAVVRCEKISARLDHYEIAVFLQNLAEPDAATLESYVARIRGRAHSIGGS
jgi:hypothetical protein